MGDPRAPAHWPITEPELFLGYHDSLFLVRIGKSCAPERVLEAIDQVGVGIDARDDSDRVAVMYYVPGELRSDIALIKRLSEVVKPRQAKLRRTTVALALVTQSTIARAALRTLLTFAGLPYPCSVVDTPADGLAFLKRHLPELDVAAIGAKITQ